MRERGNKIACCAFLQIARSVKLALGACFKVAVTKLALGASFKSLSRNWLQMRVSRLVIAGIKMFDFAELTADNIVTMSENIIDLHSHTVCSDGSATPFELVALARSQGARAIAITDHDTVAGLDAGRQAAEHFGIEFVDGIEISAEYSPGTMHILGYYINDKATTLLAKLAELRSAREKRNPEIASRLQSLGLDISYEEVAQLAGNKVVGRPHFARLMVERGYAESIQDAFNRFLAKGAAAYVEKAGFLRRIPSL